MARPNAKMKINKDGVRFESNVDAVQWTIKELIQAANADTGKFIRRETIAAIRSSYGKSVKGKRMSRAVGFWARKIEGDLQVGFGHNKFGRSGDTWYAIRQELGTKGMHKRGFLRDTVYSNIGQIQEIQGQYLSALNDKNPSVAEMKQDEMSED